MKTYIKNIKKTSTIARQQNEHNKEVIGLMTRRLTSVEFHAGRQG